MTHDNRFNPKQERYDRFVSRMEMAELDDGLPARCCGRCAEWLLHDEAEDTGLCHVNGRYDNHVTFYCLAFEVRRV